MALDAYKAKDLMRGSMDYKGFWFKARLAWNVGRMNSQIENRAESSHKTACIKMRNEDVASKYFPIMAKIYEELSFFVAYDTEEFIVCWDFDNLSNSTKFNFMHKYNYYTKSYKFNTDVTEPAESDIEKIKDELEKIKAELEKKKAPARKAGAQKKET